MQLYRGMDIGTAKLTPAEKLRNINAEAAAALARAGPLSDRRGEPAGESGRGRPWR